MPCNKHPHKLSRGMASYFGVAHPSVMPSSSASGRNWSSTNFCSDEPLPPAPLLLRGAALLEVAHTAAERRAAKARRLPWAGCGSQRHSLPWGCWRAGRLSSKPLVGAWAQALTRRAADKAAPRRELQLHSSRSAVCASMRPACMRHGVALEVMPCACVPALLSMVCQVGMPRGTDTMLQRI